MAQVDSVALHRTDSIRAQVRLQDSLFGADITCVDTGIASWYGNKWNGRMTSSGEIFHPYKMTAAHKFLPFGTMVMVTNLSNDSVVIVKITDRLPKRSMRSIDLTPAAAKRLNFYSKGLTTVKMEVLGREPILKPEKKKPAKH